MIKLKKKKAKMDSIKIRKLEDGIKREKNCVIFLLNPTQ
jgi:hypothetical protein